MIPRRSHEWTDAFIRTYLERDLPQLGINLPALTVRRFWTMLAHYHGQTWNGSELARALGVGAKTVSRYLDILEGTFMAFRLPPWHTNLGKREVKAPKVYVPIPALPRFRLGAWRRRAGGRSEGSAKASRSYDLVWYLSDPTWPEPNEALLANAVRQSGPAYLVAEAGGWKRALDRRLREAPWDGVRADVERFLERPADRWMVERETVLGILAQRGWGE